MLPIHYWNARDGFSLLILLINTTVNTSEIKTQPGAAKSRWVGLLLFHWFVMRCFNLLPNSLLSFMIAYAIFARESALVPLV